MKTSEGIAAIAPALVAVQAELRAIAKDGKNPDYGSKYATLDTIIAETRPVLTKHGLAIVQGATTPHSDDAGRIAAVAVETMLVHTSGEWIANTAIMPVVGRMLRGGGRADPDPQAGGSALTYGRRYGIAALLCLATDEDDDGNAASRQRSGGRERAGRERGTADGTSRSTQASQPNDTSAAAPSRPVAAAIDQRTHMPMGESKGTPIADMPLDKLAAAVKWARENKPQQYAVFIEAAELVLDEKSAVGV